MGLLIVIITCLMSTVLFTVNYVCGRECKQLVPELVDKCLAIVSEDNGIIKCFDMAQQKWNLSDTFSVRGSTKQICCSQWDSDQCVLDRAKSNCTQPQIEALMQYLNAYIQCENDSNCKEYPFRSTKCLTIDYA